MAISPDIEPAPLLLRAVARGPMRGPVTDLLSQSGRSERHVRDWCEDADVFALYDPTGEVDDPPAAALLAERLGDGLMCEVRLVVVAAEHRGRRLGIRLVMESGNMLRAQGVRRLVASCANTEVALMWLLQQAGFRYSHVERDGCLPERGWERSERDGVTSRDVVWFDQVL